MKKKYFTEEERRAANSAQRKAAYAAKDPEWKAARGARLRARRIDLHSDRTASNLASLQKSFEENVDYSGAAAGSSCWEWIGGRLPKGYGRLGRIAEGRGIHGYAHRMAYEIAYGPIPKGLCVCHRCDNPGCVRPEHLFLGTNKDNQNDKIKKGRARYVGLAGDLHPHSKISAADAEFIRKNYRKGVPHHPGNANELAARFGIRRSLLGYILRGQHWSVRG